MLAGFYLLDFQQLLYKHRVSMSLLCNVQAKDDDDNDGDGGEGAPQLPLKLIAESYCPPNPGPYPQDKPPENQVRFTPVQVRLLHVSRLQIACLPFSMAKETDEVRSHCDWLDVAASAINLES